MEYHNDVSNQVVLPINQLEGVTEIKLVEVCSFVGQDSIQGVELSRDPTVVLDVHPVPSSQHNTEPQDIVVNNEMQVPGSQEFITVDPSSLSLPLLNPQPQEGISVEQESAGLLSFIVEFILGREHSNPIWRLRLLCAICLAFAVVGIVFHADDLFAPAPNKSPSQIVKFIIMVIIPIFIAVISLVGSFTSIPHKWENCITGISVANCSLLIGLVVCIFGLGGKKQEDNRSS